MERNLSMPVVLQGRSYWVRRASSEAMNKKKKFLEENENLVEYWSDVTATVFKPSKFAVLLYAMWWYAGCP